MSRALTAPSAGQPVSASFFAELLREVRANRPLAGKNVRTTRTPNGTHISANSSPSSSSRRLPGLFEVKIETDGSGGTQTKFEYPYFMVGTRLYRCEDEDVTLGRVEESIACLVIDLSDDEPKGKVNAYDDFGKIQVAAADPDIAIKPLYEFGEGGTPVRDFRNMPTVSSQEFDA